MILLKLFKAMAGLDILHVPYKSGRAALNGLLGGMQSDLLDRELLALSGGERRRVELARLLTDDLDAVMSAIVNQLIISLGVLSE